MQINLNSLLTSLFLAQASARLYLTDGPNSVNIQTGNKVIGASNVLAAIKQVLPEASDLRHLALDQLSGKEVVRIHPSLIQALMPVQRLEMFERVKQLAKKHRKDEMIAKVYGYLLEEIAQLHPSTLGGENINLVNEAVELDLIHPLTALLDVPFDFNVDELRQIFHLSYQEASNNDQESLRKAVEDALVDSVLEMGNNVDELATILSLDCIPLQLRNSPRVAQFLVDHKKYIRDGEKSSQKPQEGENKTKKNSPSNSNHKVRMSTGRGKWSVASWDEKSGSSSSSSSPSTPKTHSRRKSVWTTVSKKSNKKDQSESKKPVSTVEGLDEGDSRLANRDSSGSEDKQQPLKTKTVDLPNFSNDHISNQEPVARFKPVASSYQDKFFRQTFKPRNPSRPKKPVYLQEGTRYETPSKETTHTTNITTRRDRQPTGHSNKSQMFRFTDHFNECLDDSSSEEHYRNVIKSISKAKNRKQKLCEQKEKQVKKVSQYVSEDQQQLARDQEALKKLQEDWNHIQSLPVVSFLSKKSKKVNWDDSHEPDNDKDDIDVVDYDENPIRRNNWTIPSNIGDSSDYDDDNNAYSSTEDDGKKSHRSKRRSKKHRKGTGHHGWTSFAK